MSFSPPWRSACALPNAPSPALRVKTPRRGAQCWPWGSAESGFLARRGWGVVGAAASSFCRALDGRTPRPVPETGAHTRLADRARLPRCLSRPSHPVFSHRNRLCVTTTQKTEGSSAERGGRGAAHLCSRPCPPSSFPSRDSSLRRSQMPPRPGMTGIPRRSWQMGALLAQVPGPRPALQGRESHRPLGAGGGLRRTTRRRPCRSRPTGSLALSERLSCFPFPGFLAAKL